jgi:hypothetical protein
MSARQILLVISVIGIGAGVINYGVVYQDPLPDHSVLRVQNDLVLHTSLGVALLVLALMAPFAAAIASPLLAAATGLFGLRVVLSKVGKHGRLPTRLYGIFARLGWPIQSAV